MLSLFVHLTPHIISLIICAQGNEIQKHLKVSNGADPATSTKAETSALLELSCSYLQGCGSEPLTLQEAGIKPQVFLPQIMHPPKATELFSVSHCSWKQNSYTHVAQMPHLKCVNYISVSMSWFCLMHKTDKQPLDKWELIEFKVSIEIKCFWYLIIAACFHWAT